MTLQEVRAVKEEAGRLLSMAEEAEQRLMVEADWASELDRYKSKDIDQTKYDFTGIRAVGALKHSILVAKHMLTTIVFPRNRSNY